MENDLFDIVITANSPGELYSLVRPLIKSINKNIPFVRIILVITPCQYASGKEIEVARSFKEIFDIILPQEFSKWIFLNKAPKGINFSEKGLVLFVGGDLVHGILLSKKLRYPALAYITNKIGWTKEYSLFFVPDEKLYKKVIKKVNLEKVRLVGDLMVDAALIDNYKNCDDIFDIVFFPGSRSAHIKFLAPLFLKTADIIKQKNENIRFGLALSPYCSIAQLEEHISKSNFSKLEKTFGNSGIILNTNEKEKAIKTENGTEIKIFENNPYVAMKSAKVIITIPGTNTSEAAALGKPMLVVIPTQKPEAYIFDGLAGILGNMPIIGKIIKRLAIAILGKKEKFLALPNRKANKMIVPEIRGQITAKQISKEALKLLNDTKKLTEISLQLKNVMGSSGASEKITSEIMKFI